MSGNDSIFGGQRQIDDADQLSPRELVDRSGGHPLNIGIVVAGETIFVQGMDMPMSFPVQKVVQTEEGPTESVAFMPSYYFGQITPIIHGDDGETTHTDSILFARPRFDEDNGMIAAADTLWALKMTSDNSRGGKGMWHNRPVGDVLDGLPTRIVAVDEYMLREKKPRHTAKLFELDDTHTIADVVIINSQHIDLRAPNKSLGSDEVRAGTVFFGPLVVYKSNGDPNFARTDWRIRGPEGNNGVIGIQVLSSGHMEKLASGSDTSSLPRVQTDEDRPLAVSGVHEQGESGDNQQAIIVPLFNGKDGERAM